MTNLDRKMAKTYHKKKIGSINGDTPKQESIFIQRRSKVKISQRKPYGMNEIEKLENY